MYIVESCHLITIIGVKYDKFVTICQAPAAPGAPPFIVILRQCQSSEKISMQQCFTRKWDFTWMVSDCEQSKDSFYNDFVLQSIINMFAPFWVCQGGCGVVSDWPR